MTIIALYSPLVILLFGISISLILFQPTVCAAEPEVWDGSIATDFAGGNGTEDAPYLIETPAQLAYLAQSVNSGTSYNGQYFRQTKDIVLNAANVFAYNEDGGIIGKATGETPYSWMAIGKTYDESFSGTFDGGGYRISGIFIDTTANYQGLFGRCKNATLKNIHVVEGYIKGGCGTGGIVGCSFPGTVSNCTNSGTVNGGSCYIGGIVGYNTGTVSSCTNSGTVSGDNARTGGIVGENYGTVSNCTNSGAVSGICNTGGIVGDNYSSTVSNCINSGMVSGNYNTGGIVGDNYAYRGETATVQNCYYLTLSDLPGATNGGGSGTEIMDTVVPLTDAEMRVQSNFVGFDFDTIWTMEGNPDYPYPEIIGSYQEGSASSVVITSIEPPSSIQVSYNTSFESLFLPAALTGQTESGTLPLPVTWDAASYSPTTSGEQTITGTIVLPDGYALGDGMSLEVRVSVTVEPKIHLGAIPNAVVGGYTFTLPIYATSSEEMLSFRAELTIPNTSLEDVSVSLSETAKALGAIIDFDYDTNTGALVISAIGSSDIDPGEDPLVYVTMKTKIVQEETEVPILLTVGKLNGNVVLQSQESVTVTITPNHSLQANVVYYKKAVAVPDVQISVGTVSGETDENGTVQLDGIPFADVTVSASKNAYSYEDVITAYDAVLVLRSCVNKLTLTDDQKIAADVENDGDIDEMDAVRILQFAVGIKDRFAAGSWTFVPKTQSAMLSLHEVMSVSFVAVLIGDVDGSWSDLK